MESMHIARVRRLVLVGISVLALTIAMLAASAGSNAASKKTIRIGIFAASVANTYWAAEIEGAKDAAAKYPDVKLTVFDAQFNTNKQVNQLRDALISKRFDAWFVGPNDGAPLTATIKRAIASGVKVACALVPCGPDIRKTTVQIPGLTAQIGIGFYENGQLLGQLVKQSCVGKNPCNVFWLPGLPELPLEKARTDGLKSITDTAKNIKIVAIQPGGYLAAPALKATQNVLQANPDIHVIVSSGDQMIAGAYKAARLAGVAEKIAFFGNGCTFESKRDILAGKLAGCSVYLPRTEGRMSVDLLIRAVNGERIQSRSIDPLTLSPIGPVGTKANIAKFKPEFRS
jgi:ribose transport system substrate-binding protein